VAVRAGDGVAVRARAGGEVANGRQPRAGRHAPRLDRPTEISDELAMDGRGARAAFERDDHDRELPGSNDPVKWTNEAIAVIQIAPVDPLERASALTRRAPAPCTAPARHRSFATRFEEDRWSASPHTAPT